MKANLERGELRAALRAAAGEAWVEHPDGACFLVNPAWGETERAQWRALAVRRPADWDGGRGWLAIPTGGSSGAMKLARHDEQTLGAAAAGFAAHFTVTRVDAVGLLPLWHVSGLMAFVRALATGGEVVRAAWKDVERGARPEPPTGGTAFLSLVPTQLARLLGEPTAEAWLRRFRAVPLGGAAASAALLRRAREAGAPLAPSYGMTETAAMVAAQTPAEFLEEATYAIGRALPHARLRTDAEGRLWVGGASLFFGYWPDGREQGGEWRTDDLGAIDAAGRVRVLGRSDALILTGGEKVNPAEVETALLATGWFADAAVTGLADEAWGQVVAAFYPCRDGGREPTLADVRAALAGRLAPHKLPRRLVAVPAAEWPRNAAGKLGRAELSRLASRAGVA